MILTENPKPDGQYSKCCDAWLGDQKADLFDYRCPDCQEQCTVIERLTIATNISVAPHWVMT